MDPFHFDDAWRPMTTVASLKALHAAEIVRQPDGVLAALPATPRWTAVILAGERPGGDPLAAHFGVPCKAQIRVAGVSMLRRVADALLSAPEIERVVILAQDPAAALTGDAASLLDDRRVRLEASGAGIASSIAALMETGRVGWPVLITTADHALLTRSMISEFLAGAQDCDLAIGFGERRTIEACYPDTRRTWLKFSDGQFSGANLFALRNPRVAPALRLWTEVEQDRKKSLKVISRFGPALLIRTLTRTIDLQHAIERAGAGLRLFAKPVVMRDAEAAIDVDKPGDHSLAEEILLAREAAYLA